jgi:DNA-binding response OmpR family regulator
MQIGLLEDNPTIVNLLSTILSMVGHQVSTFEEGDAFLASFLGGESKSPSVPFDLLLIDLYLPGQLSGWDVIDSIRTTIPPEQLPIIVISASGLAELKHLRASHPDIPVLQKPFAIATLLKLIKSVSAGGEQSYRESA